MKMQTSNKYQSFVTKENYSHSLRALLQSTISKIERDPILDQLDLKGWEKALLPVGGVSPKKISIPSILQLPHVIDGLQLQHFSDSKSDFFSIVRSVSDERFHSRILLLTEVVDGVRGSRFVFCYIYVLKFQCHSSSNHDTFLLQGLTRQL